MSFQAKNVAIDIHDLDGNRRGERIANALVLCGGTLYRTARGRKAVLVPRVSFERLRTSMKFDVEDARDGLLAVVLAAD